MSFDLSLHEDIFAQLRELYSPPFGPIDLIGATPLPAEIPPDPIRDAVMAAVGIAPSLSHDLPPDERGALDDLVDFVLDGTLDVILAYVEGTLTPAPPPAQEQAILDLMAEIMVDGRRLNQMTAAELRALREEGADEKGLIKKIWRRIKQVARRIFQTIAGLVVEVGKFYLNVEKTEVEEANATLHTIPTFTLGQGGIGYQLDDIFVDFKIRIYLRLMGLVHRDVALSKSGIKFQARGGLETRIDGRKIQLRVRVDNADAILTESIFTVRVTVTVGLTGIMQKQVDRLGWLTILDIDPLEIRPPFANRPLFVKPARISHAAGQMTVHCSTG